jgi:sterol desaturase/sphingolipid hydroxylase (fatty acid hydroxylase superfamily)
VTPSAISLIIGTWAILLFVAERVFPATPWPVNGSRRLIRNLTFGLMAAIASPLFQYGIDWVFGRAQPLVQITDYFGPIGGTALLLLILDAWTYMLHRAYHRIPLMWRLHAPHHFDKHLDVTSAIRFHVGEIALSSLLRLIPVIMLGISPETNLLFGAILTMCALFHHSNIGFPARFERGLSCLIVTPAIHWVHHHAVQRDTDSNYASILSVWDRLFGSTSATIRTPHMPIGVEGVADKPLLALLAYPVKADS